MSFINRLSQAASVSTNNSSTANLAGGASFTGTSDSTLNAGLLQISLKTDQNCTVIIEQSPNGTNWDIIDTFTYYYSIDNFSRNVTAVNSYFRVRVTNLSPSVTTTYFRLQSVLLPIGSALPRATDENDSLRVGVKSIEDEYGFSVENTPMGEMRVAEVTRLVGAGFEGTTLDPNFWTATTANSATIAQANAQVVLTSGTNSAGSAILNSVRRARYVSGTGMRYRAVIQLGDTGTASNVKVWGVAWGASMPTITDGAYFRLNGTTFSIVTLRGNTPTEITSGNFNGTLGATYAPTTSATTYEIYWTNTKVYFVVGGVILHTVSTTTQTWAGTMSPYIYQHNINAGNTTSTTLTVRVASIARMGELLTQPMGFYQALGQTAGTQLKYGLGNIHSIIISRALNNSVITLSDSTTTSTPVRWSMTAGAAINSPIPIDLKGLPFFDGLRLTISGANAEVSVIYE